VWGHTDLIGGDHVALSDTLLARTQPQPQPNPGPIHPTHPPHPTHQVLKHEEELIVLTYHLFELHHVRVAQPAQALDLVGFEWRGVCVAGGVGRCCW